MHYNKAVFCSCRIFNIFELKSIIIILMCMQCFSSWDEFKANWIIEYQYLPRYRVEVINSSIMSSWSSLHCCSAETHRSSSAYLLVKLVAHFLQQLLVFTADRSGIIISETPACDGTVIQIRRTPDVPALISVNASLCHTLQPKPISPFLQHPPSDIIQQPSAPLENTRACMCVCVC